MFTHVYSKDYKGFLCITLMRWHTRKGKDKHTWTNTFRSLISLICHGYLPSVTYIPGPLYSTVYVPTIHLRYSSQLTLYCCPAVIIYLISSPLLQSPSRPQYKKKCVRQNTIKTLLNSCTTAEWPAVQSRNGCILKVTSTFRLDTLKLYHSKGQ